MDTKVENKVTILSDTLKEFFGDKMKLARIKFFGLFISALCKVQTVCFEKLACSFDTNVRVDSSLRRIQRFISEYSLDSDMIARFVFSLLPHKPPFRLALDRTNWKFRQDNDAAKIITLDTWVRDLKPNHEYLLQRAMDTNFDGNCTGTAWLTLGMGLTPQSIITDDKGTGQEELWRDVSALATGATFDIHFQIIDAVTSAVVLTSDCYQYTIR
jgi:hypothetical protein